MQWESFIEALNRKFKATHDIRDLKTKVKTEYDLIKYLHTDTVIRNFLSFWLGELNNDKVYKSVEKARMHKSLGNREFHAKNYIASIESYTKSATYAPPESDDLPVAIANRSASLFYLQRYEDCIRDIKLAIKFKYPEKLRYKLYLRTVQCYLKLNKKKLAQEAMNQVYEMTSKCNDISDMKRGDIEKQISQLNGIMSSMTDDSSDSGDVINSKIGAKYPTVTYGENPTFPSASVAIDRKHAPKKGRHVIANRDIKRGDVLFVEKPFAFVLLDQEKSNGLCENCCAAYGNVPVPCTKCVGTFYCDSNCQEIAWSTYHQWECPGNQTGIWPQVGVAYLALRVLLTTIYSSDRERIRELQSLVTNMDKVPPEDLIVCGITTTMLTLYLKQTDFFNVINIKESLVAKLPSTDPEIIEKLETDEGKFLFINSILLRYILQLVPNGFAITRLNTTLSGKERVLIEEQDRVASAIYTSASMLNHSCDPNIISSFADQYLIIKATKDIAAGEEVFNCYGPNFRRMSREQRQEVLNSQYYFTCTCEACTNLEFEYFMERFTAIKCSTCSGAVSLLNGYNCLDCGATAMVSYQVELKEAQDLFDAAQVYIESEREEEEALDKLKQSLGIRRNILYKYHEDITATLDLIGRVYAILGRWLESISYLEHSITAVEERYGSTSIELAHELNKITDICIQYLQQEPNTATKWYKNTLKKTRRYLERAEEILNLNYGPWVEAFTEIVQKRKVLSHLLKHYNI